MSPGVDPRVAGVTRFEVSRYAIVEDDDGELVNLFQAMTAAVRVTRALGDGREVSAVVVLPPGSARYEVDDVGLVALAGEEGLLERLDAEAAEAGA